MKRRKVLSRVTAIILVISVMVMGFPGMLLAEDSNLVKNNTTTSLTSTTMQNLISLINLTKDSSVQNTSTKQSSEDSTSNNADNSEKIVINNTSVGTIQDSQDTAENSSANPYLLNQNPVMNNGNNEDNSNIYSDNDLSDNSTATGDDATYPIKNKAGKNYSVGFAKKSGDNLLQFTYGKASLSLSPLNSAKIVGKFKKNSILYKDVYPNIDFLYVAEDSRLKEDIIINKLSDQNEFSFKVKVKNAKYQTADDGTICFLESGTSCRFPSYLSVEYQNSLSVGS